MTGFATMRSKLWMLLLISGGIVVLDQISKAMVQNALPLYHSITVIPGFFDITHVHNPGGAFGFLAGASRTVRTLMFLVVSLLAVVLILWFFFNTPSTHPWLAGGFALILGGAAGNLIDRIRFGKVIDFLDLYVGNLHWPAFNVADSAITVGIGIFIAHLFLKKLPD